MKYYYNNETGKIESLDDLKRDYDNLFRSEYKTFSDYISACMYWNNGALETLTDHVMILSARLRSLERIATKYKPIKNSFFLEEYTAPEYIDEVETLKKEIEYYSKYNDETYKKDHTGAV